MTVAPGKRGMGIASEFSKLEGETNGERRRRLGKDKWHLEVGVDDDGADAP